MPHLPRLALALAVACCLIAPAAARAAHPHYLRLLQQGTFALERGETDDAVHDLRLACFGLLEEPALLGECLVRLGLAQVASGDDEGFRDTFRRVVEVQERFDGYDGAEVGLEERAAFERAIVERVAARTLRYSDAFDHLAPPAEPEQPPAVRETEEPAGESTPPTDTTDSPRAPGPERTGSVQSETTGPTDTLSDEERATLRRARSLLAEARRRDELEAPYRLASQVAEANPGVQEAQHLAAIIAYRASRWKEAVRYFRRGGDPGAEDAEALFYFAVSLYETGARDEAAAALRRSLPRLEETPFVLRYRERILGPGEGGSGR